jgi:hypothetical protein
MERGFTISRQYSWDRAANQTLDVYYQNIEKLSSHHTL